MITVRFHLLDDDLCGGDSHNSSPKSLPPISTGSKQCAIWGLPHKWCSVLTGSHRGESFYKQVTLGTKLLGLLFCLQVQNTPMIEHKKSFGLLSVLAYRRSCSCIKAEISQVSKKPGQCLTYQLQSDNTCTVINFSPLSIISNDQSQKKKERWKKKIRR